MEQAPLPAEKHQSADPLSLHIGIEYAKGGEGRVVNELRHALPAAGFRFRGLVAAPPDAAELTGGEVCGFARQGASLPERLLQARKAIGHALAESSVSIVASHFALYTAPALDLLPRGRLVSHFHGPWALESLEEGAGRTAARLKQRLESAVYRRADRMIVLSQAFADLATRTFGVPAERIRLVPGSVDVERFSVPASRAESQGRLSLPTDRPILIAVRRLVKRMGLPNLLEAMRHVSEAVPDVLLCIGGQGVLRPELEQQVKEKGLARNVQFLGFVPEELLPHLYHAAAINVVPSTALEGFGLVAAEALAAGTPSMVTPIGGLPEVVSGLDPCLVFQDASAEAIARGLTEALLGRTKLPGETECRAYAQKNFSSARMAQQTAAVYRELL